ncbi:hypothetical protein MMC22_002385 [Lobaria immixta]|nr:hypothetical protein [Lobaria immixta]
MATPAIKAPSEIQAWSRGMRTDKAVFDIATRFTLMTRAQLHNLDMLRTTESRLWNGVAESTNTGKEHGRKFRIPKLLAEAPHASSPPKGLKDPQQHQVLESLGT